MSAARGVVTGLLAVATCLACQAGEQDSCPIVPRPKQYEDLGKTMELLAPGAAVIVVGARASQPERYAAETLQAQVQRRFQQKLPIHAETDVPAAARQWLLLGQAETSDRLKGLCQVHGISLNANSPGPDGYLIRCVEDGARQGGG